MKKIFTLIFAMIAVVGASAANFQLLRGEDYKESSGTYIPGSYKPVYNGDAYVTGYFVKDIPPVFKFYQQESELYIKGPAGLEMTFEVESSAPVQVCCLGQCEVSRPSEVVRKTGKLDPSSTDLMAGTEDIYNLRIDKTGNLSTETVEEIVVKVTAYETSNPSDKMTVTVTMSTKTYEQMMGNVDGISAATEFVKLTAGNILKYNVEQAARLELFNIAGRQVYSRQIQGTGSIKLDLGQGVYIYRVGKLTGKFLVK